MGDNWRQRMDEALVTAENARAARFRAADEALQAVLYLDMEVVPDGADRDALSRARQIILDLRQVW